MRIVKQILLLCLLGLAVVAQTPALSKDLQVGAIDWVDTGVDLRAGDSVRVSSTGSIVIGQKTTGPGGANRGFTDLIKAYPVNNAGAGALIARIGNSEAATPFLIGTSKQFDAPRAGRLFLAANRSNLDKFRDRKSVV